AARARGAAVSGVLTAADVSAAGRAAERAPRSPAQLGPPGRGRPRRARRPAKHRHAGREPAAGPRERRAAAGQRGPARGERLFRQRDRPDPEVVMSFIDAHDFPAGLVLRVLGIPASTYYDWRARRVSPSRRELDDAALLEQILKTRAARGPARAGAQASRRARVRRRLRLPAGVAGAAPPGRAGRAQARGADHARPRAARRAPAARLEARLDPAEPEPYRRAGPG